MNYTPQTEVHLLSNVPFNFSYNNVMDFDTINEQTTYFLNKSKLTFEDLTHQRVNNNSINLEVAYEDLYEINYMMFQNDKIPGKWFYAFITNYDFVSPNVTRITYQIDVYQTWLFEMNFQTTYVEREHTKRFNSDGTPVINTLDEGLQYGTDYDISSCIKYEQIPNVIWAIMIAKVDLERIPSSMNYGGSTLGNVQTPLYFYTVPISLDGADITLNNWTPADISNIFGVFSANSDFVGSIVTMYYTSFMPMVLTHTTTNNTINITALDGIDHVTVAGLEMFKITNSDWNTLNPQIYANLFDAFPNYSESKLYMYPYSLIEITNLKGESVTLKPQNFNFSIDKELRLRLMSSVSTTPKTAIFPENYLNSTNILGFDDFTCGIIDNNLSDIPIIDDYTASYMQANRNSIATTNKYAMDNALRGVSQNNANNRLNNAILDKEQKFGEYDMFTGAMSSAFQLNAGGILNSINRGARDYSLNEGKRASMNMNNDFANKNLMINAEQSIGLTQAKINDINNIPPSVSNLGNNALFDYGNKINGVYIIGKTIRPEYREQLTNYFKMFGYKVNKLEIPNTKSRRYYNYIKTIDANIVGNIPSNDLSAIKGIFDKGVTIWHTDQVGDYSLNNSEVN